MRITSYRNSRHESYQSVHMSLVRPVFYTIVSFSVVSSPSANLSQRYSTPVYSTPSVQAISCYHELFPSSYQLSQINSPLNETRYVCPG